jgi:hypothetical protein
MRVYRIPCSDFLVACGQYVFVMRGKVTATAFTATDDVSALGAQDDCSRVRRLRALFDEDRVLPYTRVFHLLKIPKYFEHKRTVYHIRAFFAQPIVTSLIQLLDEIQKNNFTQ